MSDSNIKYKNLFDNKLNAMAYCQVVVDLKGKPIDYVFLEVNKTFERLTALKRNFIINRKVTDIISGFGKSEASFIRICGNVALTGNEVTFERHFEAYKNNSEKWYSFFVYSPKKGFFVSISSDITKRKEAEEELRQLNIELEKRVADRTKKLTSSNKLLKLSNKSASKKEYLDAVLKYIKNITKCGYLGIRILKDDGNIPFESFIGYSSDFLKSENSISIHDDNCICIRAILSKPGIQDKKSVTKGGSFFLENSFEFMAGLSQERKKKFRGKCISCGFVSFVAIPIKSKKEIIGTVHIADKRTGLLSLEKVESVELLTPLIGEAIKKFDADEKVAKSEEKYQDLVENISDGIYQLDTNGKVVYASPIIKQITGYSPEEVLGRDVVSFVHPDDLDEAKIKLRESISGKSEPYETRIIKKDGSIAYVRTAGHTLIKNGKIEGVVSILADITERKKREESLLESYNYLGVVNRKISMLLDLEKFSESLKDKGKDRKFFLEYILKSAINVSGADTGLFYQNINSENFRLLHSIGISGMEKEGMRNISTKSYEIFEKIQKEKIKISGLPGRYNLKRFNFSGKTKYFIILPIKAEKKLEGFIFLSFLKEKFIDNHELSFLDVFAVQMSHALANAGFFK
jgi:PAS domain S-box-containing protein